MATDADDSFRKRSLIRRNGCMSINTSHKPNEKPDIQQELSRASSLVEHLLLVSCAMYFRIARLIFIVHRLHS